MVEGKRIFSERLQLENLCERVAEEYKRLGSSAARLPSHFPAPSPALHDRRLVYVDDSVSVMELFIPSLVALTNGSCIFIHHRDESMEELVGKILGASPELVLLDGELAGITRGWEVAARLYQASPDVPVVGFSSSPFYRKLFLDHCAVEFVTKDRGAIAETVRAVEEIAEAYFSKP